MCVVVVVVIRQQIHLNSCELESCEVGVAKWVLVFLPSSLIIVLTFSSFRRRVFLHFRLRFPDISRGKAHNRSSRLHHFILFFPIFVINTHTC